MIRTEQAAWPQKDAAVHAVGSAGALCGAALTIMPMNFAPLSRFGVGQDKWGRDWCADCLERWSGGPQERAP